MAVAIRFRRVAGAPDATSTDSAIPVSYTHLDVYKRQGQSAQNLANSPNPASLQNSGETIVKRMTFREAASVVANQEAGVISVRATSRQHEKVQEFIDRVMNSARRQVLIEATIIEVSLSDGYQQGIDWSRVTSATVDAGFGITLSLIHI